MSSRAHRYPTRRSVGRVGNGAAREPDPWGSALAAELGELLRWNLQHVKHARLGIDAPTDVLSFPASEADPLTGAAYHGDILISIPRAKAPAKAAGHALEAEVQLLVVHGVLHLLGHDHAEAKEKKKMWKAQAEILERLGLSEIEIREA